MIQLRSSGDKTLKIILANTNKALHKVLQESNPKDLQLLNKSKDLGSILESLMKTNPQDHFQNRALLTLLKNNPTLKELSNVNTTLKGLEQTLLKENSSNFSKLTELISKLLHHTKNTIDDKTVKKNIENSGIFLESKLKNASSEKLLTELSEDFKVVLNRAKEELTKSEHPQRTELLKQMDKLSLQIDYYQLLSHLSNATCIYLPYSFDALEDGNITIKKGKNKNYFCDINLILKEYGPLFLRLGLFEKNQLNINIQCESKELESKLKKDLKTLREKLFKVNIHPQEIRFLEDNSHKDTYQETQEIALGFEVKV